MATNVRIIGSGEVTLVLAHGYGTSQAVWDEVISELSKRYQLLLFDWSFSGVVNPPIAFDSNVEFSFEYWAEELISLLDMKNLKDAVFVGHSMSGMIGCAAYIKRPDLFTHLVLVGASPRYINSEDCKGGSEPAAIEDVLKSIQTDFDAWAEAFTPIIFGTNNPTSLRKIIDSIKSMNPATRVPLAKMIFFCDERHTLDLITAPCTLILGANDIVVPPSVGDYVKSKMKGKVSVVSIENCAHFPQITAPDKFVEIIDSIQTHGV